MVVSDLDADGAGALGRVYERRIHRDGVRMPSGDREGGTRVRV